MLCGTSAYAVLRKNNSENIMKLKGGTCPKCSSSDTCKEKIMGQDTGDIICLKCRYIGHWSEFHKSSTNETTNIENEDNETKN